MVVAELARAAPVLGTAGHAGVRSADHHSYRRDVQGLRAIAVIVVVLYHAHVPGFTGGFIGVDVFFVISGFVIGSSLRREFERTGTISLKEFYSRRIRRLLPAFALMATVTLALSAVLMEIGEVQKTAARTGIAATMSVSNLYLLESGESYFGVLEERNPFLHTWSLGVEEQFYLVVPLLMVGLLAVGRATRWSQRSVVVAGLAVLAFASLTIADGHLDGWNDRVAFYSPVDRFWELGAGMLLALLSWRVRRGTLTAMLSLAVIALACARYGESTAFPGRAAIPVVLATVAMILAVPHSRLVRPILEHDSLGWIGDRSYGLYLWHWPAIVVAREWWGDEPGVLVAAAVVSVVPTALSYRFIEQPFRGAPFRHTGRRLASRACVMATAVVVASALLHVGADRSWGLEIDRVERDGLAFRNRCQGTHGWTPTGGAFDRCTFVPAGASKGAVVLVGDSHAGAIADGVVQAITRNGYTAIVTTQPSCPFLDVAIVRTRVGVACDGYRLLAWGLIEQLDAVAVVMAHDSAGYPNRVLRDPLVTDPSGDVIRDRRVVVSMWSEALARAHRRLEAAGVAVISLDVIPTYAETYTVRPSTVLRPHRAEIRMSLEDLDEQRGEVIDLEHQVLRTGFWIDAAAPLCSEPSGCSTRSATGAWRYSDETHLSRLGSLELADHLTREFERIFIVLDR